MRQEQLARSWKADIAFTYPSSSNSEIPAPEMKIAPISQARGIKAVLPKNPDPQRCLADLKAIQAGQTAARCWRWCRP